ncbi:MAG TPA: hypothetical protein VEX18_07735, partial [Polyangiaceae bacterium]|nr:hypothetical protein [Polyangiaceae bacterium]
DDIERGKLYTTIGNITLAVGVAAVAGGVVLVLTSGPGNETAKARKTYPKLALAPAPGGAQLIGNF